MYECFANANLTRVRHNRQCFGPIQTDSEYTVYSLQAILGIRFSSNQSFSLQPPAQHQKIGLNIINYNVVWI
jgi:hypothetical protein